MTRARRADDYPYFDNAGRPLAFAHRGGVLLAGKAAPENTMAAFQAAIDLGYRYVETDVQATSDGGLVVFHDDTLGRLTNGHGSIGALTAAEVKALTVGGTEPIPLADDLFASWPDICFNIDAKTPQSAPLLAQVIDRHQAWDRVCVASFSARTTQAVRAVMDPRVATSFSRAGVVALLAVPTRWARDRVLGGGQVAQVPPRRGSLEIITPRFIERAHEAGKHVHAWTIDDSDEANRLLDLGVDAIMADHTETLREVYRARGIWRD